MRLPGREGFPASLGTSPRARAVLEARGARSCHPRSDRTARERELTFRTAHKLTARPPSCRRFKTEMTSHRRRLPTEAADVLIMAYEDERFPTAQRRAELADQAGITPRCAAGATALPP